MEKNTEEDRLSRERCLAGSLERCLADLQKELRALHRAIVEAITSTPPWKLAVAILKTEVKDDWRIPTNRPIAENGIRSEGRAQDSLAIYLARDDPGKNKAGMSSLRKNLSEP